MKPFEIALIAFASVIAAFILFISCCLCQGSRKKKQTSKEEPNAVPTVTTSSVQEAYRDVEKGQTAKSSATKDGEMVVYAAAVAAVDTAAVVASTSGCGD
ncbi:hypothetical protein FH972_027137 [Carpinus fangiana]|uniref:Uncharacterized protein n=1 Tax=Carpinus fangiana TaxID=176857 RepID=A0A5N6L8I3_9ROSI|nr:hypothetical protein FH972_027137 [Carpinus fangiana]